jgi:hypothetical protein
MPGPVLAECVQWLCVLHRSFWEYRQVEAVSVWPGISVDCALL